MNYEDALQDSTNQRVMIAVITSFGIRPEKRQEIMQAAMMRCCKQHRCDRGQKFTTSLYRFTRWECQNFIRGAVRAPKMMSLVDIPEPAVPVHDRQDEIDHIHECLTLLSRKDRALIQQYYLDNMTLEEIGTANQYSRAAAHQNLVKATSRLRRLCCRLGVFIYLMASFAT
jgi:RNA polymerase sigma factor (sigma-70 family)